MTDPDRWVNPQAPGAHEWWYFDAISDDGRDTIVIVWYSALPVDPRYGLASLRHIQQPDRYPRPYPLDFCAVEFNWYRDGRTMAYALNQFNREQFRHQLENGTLALDVHRNQLTRDPRGLYHLKLDTPALVLPHKAATSIRVSLSFKPSSTPIGWEHELGTDRHPHLWILAAPDCHVSGVVRAGENHLDFQGRGYHDHNVGGDELSRSFRRWHWGRFHDEDKTRVYYLCEPDSGPSRGHWLKFENGQLTDKTEIDHLDTEYPRLNRFGLKYHSRLQYTPEKLAWRLGKAVDNGPFYLRWIGQSETARGGHGRGVCELFQTDRLHRPWFNWMVSLCLKRPLG